MRIQELHLKNFRQFTSLDFIFSKINVISGETGKGKSSVLEALSLGLCDTVKKNLENCINRKASKAEVNLKTIYRGDLLDYTIELGKKTSRELQYKNTTFLNSDAIKELEKIVDSKITLYSNFSLQKKTSEILQDKPTARLQKIKSIFKIDKINKNVISQIKLDISEIESNILKLDTQLGMLKQRSFSYLSEPIINEINESQVEQEIKDLKIKKLEYEKHKSEYDLYLRDQANYQKALSSISLCEDIINNSTLQIIEKKTTLRPIKDFNSDEYQNIGQEISKIKQQLDAFEILDTKTNELNSIKLLRVSRNSGELLQEKIDELTQKNGDLTVSSQDNKRNYDLYTNKICPVTSLQCSEIKSDIDLSTFLTIINENISLISTNKNEIKGMQDEIKSIDEIKNKNEIAQSKRDYIQENINELSLKVSGLQQDILKSTYAEKLVYFDVLKLVYQENIQNEQHNKSIEKTIKDIEQKLAVEQGKLQELQKITAPDIKESPVLFDEASLENKQLLLQEWRFNIKERERIQNFNKELKTQEKENTKNYTRIEKEIYDLRNKIVQLKELQKLLDKQFSSWLISTGTTFIKDKMNDFFDRSYGKYYIDFAYEGDGLELVYAENKNDTRFYSTEDLSGFESDIYSLAFRTALCSLQDLDFLIYDEIDSQGSTDRSLSLFQTIIDTLGNRQLFVVTHNDYVKEFLLQQEGSKLFQLD